jgi:hypothetical protein
VASTGRAHDCERISRRVVQRTDISTASTLPPLYSSTYPLYIDCPPSDVAPVFIGILHSFSGVRGLQHGSTLQSAKPNPLRPAPSDSFASERHSMRGESCENRVLPVSRPE